MASVVLRCRPVRDGATLTSRVNTNIQTIAVIGADAQGRAIALACLRAKYATILEDVSRSRLDDAVASLEQNGVLGVNVAPGSLARHPSCGLRTTSVIEDAVRDADLIIESAADELEVKLELFTLFDKFAKPGAILASTSASLSIADMASVTFCADRCIGLRFDDVAQSNAIELVVTPETSTDTVVACREFARRLNKEVRIVREGDPALKRGAAR